MLPALGLAALVAIPCVMGVALADHPWLNFAAVVGVVLWTAVGVAAAAQSYDGDVSTFDVVAGVVVGGVFLGAAPFGAYYGLGRWLARRRIVLAIVVVASLLPLAYYLFVAFVIAVGFIGCPPDSYECPV